MKILLIDDIRDIAADMVCRDFDSGLKALINLGPWDLLYLDHDLGQERTGYDIACFIEANPQYAPDRVYIVTANSVGRKNIELALKRYYTYDFTDRVWIISTKI